MKYKNVSINIFNEIWKDIVFIFIGCYKNFRKLKEIFWKIKNDSRNYKCYRSLKDKINVLENKKNRDVK